VPGGVDRAEPTVGRDTRKALDRWFEATGRGRGSRATEDVLNSLRCKTPQR
jgi:hypothetical protein